MPIKNIRALKARFIGSRLGTRGEATGAGPQPSTATGMPGEMPSRVSGSKPPAVEPRSGAGKHGAHGDPGLEPWLDFDRVAPMTKKSLGAKALVYPAPVLVIGSYDKAGKANLATASWGGICCSQPPCIAISLRKATYSYENILARKAFTVSLPSESHVKEVDFVGIISGRSTDKVAETGLTTVKSKLVDAPYVKEFPFVLECKVVDIAEVGLHSQFIGEILDVKVDESVLGVGGAVEIRKLKPLIYSPDTQEYYGVGKLVGKVFSAGKDLV